MSIGPVIIRELRAEARRPANHGLRITGAGGLLVAVALAAWTAEDPSTVLFGYANAAVLLAICLLVPAATADCISREKREGTLGLLFLTPLTAYGIVAGKSFVHGLRALTLYVTMLPVTAVSMLAGGVSAKDLLMALLIQSGALLLALAAGVLASAFSRERMKAVALAVILSFLFLLTYLSIHCWVVAGLHSRLAATRSGGSFEFWLDISGWDQGFAVATISLFAFGSKLWSGGDAWTTIWVNGLPALHQSWIVSALGLVGGAGAVLLCVIYCASLKLERSWKDAPQSIRSQRWKDFFCQPRFYRRTFRRSLRRALDRNPIGWLHFYSWKTRMIKWGWCLGVLVLECMIATSWANIEVGQWLILIMVLGGLAFHAAGSFRKDRETGALELLVVTPLRSVNIIGGRVVAIWAQFAPTFMGLIALWLFMEDALVLISFALATYLTLPVIGLFFSLQRLSVPAAWLLACITGLGLPIALTWATDPSETAGATYWLVSIYGWQGIIATVAAYALVVNLRQRRFALGY